MKFHRNEKYEQIAVYSVISLAVLILLYFFFQRFEAVRSVISVILASLSPFVYGGIFAYLANPVMMFFENKVFKFKKESSFSKKARRPLSLVCAVLLILLLIFLFFFLMIPQIAASYDELQQKIGGYIVAAQGWADEFVRSFPLFNGQYKDLAEFLDLNEITSRLQEMISNSYKYISSAANYLIEYAGKFVVEVKNIILGVILAIYLLLSKDKLIGQAKKICASLLSERKYVNLISLAKYTDRSFGQYIRGMLLDSCLIGLIMFVILWIFDFPFYPLIALIIGVTNMIPMFGPFIGGIPSAFLIFIVDPIKALWFVLIIVILQQIDGNIICPRILGNATGLNALWVVVSITIGSSLFGIVGMILAVPTMSVIYTLVRESVAYRLKKRGMCTDTEYYSSHPTAEELPKNTIFIRDEVLSDDPEGGTNDSEE